MWRILLGAALAVRLRGWTLGWVGEGKGKGVRGKGKEVGRWGVEEGENVKGRREGGKEVGC